MRLTDLLQLINDLNINTTFYLKIDDKVVPWGKLTLVDGRCLLYPGEKAMTKANAKLRFRFFIQNTPLFKMYKIKVPTAVP